MNASFHSPPLRAHLTPPSNTETVPIETQPVLTPVDVPPSAMTPLTPAQLATQPLPAQVQAQIPNPSQLSPMQPAASAPTPTWLYVVGGIALAGLVGFFLWAVSSGGSSAASESRPNPLRRRRRRRNRFGRRGRR